MIVIFDVLRKVKLYVHLTVTQLTLIHVKIFIWYPITFLRKTQRSAPTVKIFWQ